MKCVVMVGGESMVTCMSHLEGTRSAAGFSVSGVSLSVCVRCQFMSGFSLSGVSLYHVSSLYQVSSLCQVSVYASSFLFTSFPPQLTSGFNLPRSSVYARLLFSTMSNLPKGSVYAR